VGKQIKLLDLEARTKKMIATLSPLFMAGMGSNGTPPIERVRKARAKLWRAAQLEDDLRRTMRNWPAREEFLKPKLKALKDTAERVESRIESFKKANQIREESGEELTHANAEVGEPPAR